MQHHANGAIPAWLANIRHANGDGRRLTEELFWRALNTLAVLDDADAKWFDIRTSWPRFPRDDWFGYSIDDYEDEPERFVPTPHDLSIMLDVLALGRALDRRQWKIVTDRAAGFSWEAIGVRRHLAAEVAQWHYGRALDAVVAAALAA